MRWTLRERLAAAFTVVFIATQFAVPLALLPGNYHERAISSFGWQMYAHQHTPPPLHYVMAGGTTTPIPAGLRPRVWKVAFGYRERVASYLCRRQPNATAVEVRAEAPVPYAHRYPCAR